MIFVTVGTQLSFDRLVRAVDEWAGHGDRPYVFAQIGPTDFQPVNLDFRTFIDPTEFDERAKQAAGIVAHAGMGSILTALQYRKPILVMPRRAALSEQRNDHQMATVARFGGHPGILVARDETEIPAMLDKLLQVQAGDPISPHASPSLIAAIRRFIEGC